MVNFLLERQKVRVVCGGRLIESVLPFPDTSSDLDVKLVANHTGRVAPRNSASHRGHWGHHTAKESIDIDTNYLAPKNDFFPAANLRQIIETSFVKRVPKRVMFFHLVFILFFISFVL